MGGLSSFHACHAKHNKSHPSLSSPSDGDEKGDRDRPCRQGMRENGLVHALCDCHPRELCMLCKASHLLGSTLTGNPLHLLYKMVQQLPLKRQLPDQVPGVFNLRDESANPGSCHAGFPHNNLVCGLQGVAQWRDMACRSTV